MMKKNLLAVMLIFISGLVFSQDYKKKFSQAVCDCIKKIDTESGASKDMSSEFGICAFKAAQPYKKEIKQDYDVDLVADLANEEKLKNFGVQVGVMMMGECADTFLKVMKSDDSNGNEEAPSEVLINGTITKVEKDNFIIFHLVGDNKILNKFYWIGKIDSNLDLPKEYNSLINKKVSISYYTAEIFDVKINDYRNLNIISSLKTD
ncbi:hypothetical protein M2347_004045 [Chryseobacterium sp. H1D6B]|uniref:hypothetical protein n=1 Tax=Chryseobacterium sp. H1D6B TaxID=2940588 RepID=UPI0015CBDB6B|nr:hypothetical protein [Chryseobacterium sp. H1D6B]MDH6254318.1 hypothetical protein [Chryseobacterium sp. H1D6B]